jgi:short-subunit dehydrogenase
MTKQYAVITGASSGIGKEIAKRLSKEALLRKSGSPLQLTELGKRPLQNAMN